MPAHNGPSRPTASATRAPKLALTVPLAVALVIACTGSPFMAIVDVTRGLRGVTDVVRSPGPLRPGRRPQRTDSGPPRRAPPS